MRTIWVVEMIAVLVVTAACAERQAQDSLPVRLKVVFPRYPAEAHGIQADVELAVTVSADGRTSDVAVVKSGGPEFDRAAIESTRATTWVPARKNGVAVPYRLQFTVRFRPENDP